MSERKTTFELYQESAALVERGMAAVDEPEDWLAAVDVWVGSCDDKLLAVRVIRARMLARADEHAIQRTRFGDMEHRARLSADRMDAKATDLIVAREALVGDGAKIPTSDTGWCKMQAYPKVWSHPELDLRVLGHDYPELVEVIVTPTRLKLDKVAAKALLKAGESIAGLRLDENRRIKWSK